MLVRLLASALLGSTLAVTPVHVCAAEPPLPAAAIDAVARDAAAARKAPGFAIAVVRGGAVAYEQAFGERDVARKLPVTVDTPFAIGSVSKQFTAAAVLLLAEEKKLRLDDTLAAHGIRLPNAEAITLRELLNQTSGLHNYPLTTEHAWPLHGAIATQTLLDILATDNPDFAPGTKWAYSNANYAVLTAVVERAAGEPMAAFLKSRVFAPAGMREAGFGAAAQARAETALAYAGAAPYQRQDELSADLFSGAGAVYASIDDLARWDLALLGGRLLAPASRDAMFARGTLRGGAPVDYGMGFVPAIVDGHRMVWHNGLAPGAGGYCFNALFPDDDFAIAVVSNGYNFDGQPERIAREVFRIAFAR